MCWALFPFCAGLGEQILSSLPCFIFWNPENPALGVAIIPRPSRIRMSTEGEQPLSGFLQELPSPSSTQGHVCVWTESWQAP